MTWVTIEQCFLYFWYLGNTEHFFSGLKPLLAHWSVGPVLPFLHSTLVCLGTPTGNHFYRRCAYMTKPHHVETCDRPWTAEVHNTTLIHLHYFQLKSKQVQDISVQYLLALNSTNCMLTLHTNATETFSINPIQHNLLRETNSFQAVRSILVPLVIRASPSKTASQLDLCPTSTHKRMVT